MCFAIFNRDLSDLCIFLLSREFLESFVILLLSAANMKGTSVYVFNAFIRNLTTTNNARRTSHPNHFGWICKFTTIKFHLIVNFCQIFPDINNKMDNGLALSPRKAIYWHMKFNIRYKYLLKYFLRYSGKINNVS